MEGDIFAGFDTRVAFLNSSTDFLVANPSFYVEAGLRGALEIDFVLVSYQLRLDMEGFRYNPLDFTFLWSVANLANYCYSMQWSTSGLKAKATTVLYADECQLGLFGGLYFNQMA